ncbi:hypothetical protein BCV71DRAFT_258214 [Rhizopus microsporus]|uniref:Uncharacterized protein n=1 Tax=Rhizopus microsporus TaxID=58291 RepID=A0A1X0RPW3_RHIZD|nr:hypothetical protein BCV71DRAFT_258214 [Rhizopus microsporus]
MGVLAALTFLIPRLLLVDPSRLISESVGMAFLSFCFLQQQLTSLSLFLCSLSSANFSLCASPDQDGAPLLLPSTPERSTTDVQCTLSGVNTTIDKVCLVALDYTGLLTDCNDLYGFLIVIHVYEHNELLNEPEP